MNTLGGVLWGAFNLVSFNFLLSLTPDAQRARFSAFYQILVMLALAGGAAFGAWVVTQWGYQCHFLMLCDWTDRGGGLVHPLHPGQSRKRSDIDRDMKKVEYERETPRTFCRRA